MNISLKILFNLLYSIYNKYKYQRTCTMKEYVSRFSDSFCCIVCGCVKDVSDRCKCRVNTPYSRESPGGII